MKNWIIILSLLMSFAAVATEVDGEIFYTVPSGDLASRSVTLDVPSRGRGEVVLRGNSFEWRTDKFYSRKIAGKQTFVAIFETEFRGEKSRMAFVGTYIRSNDQIRYYGDIYKRKNKGEPFSFNLKGFGFIGGFDFRYQR